MTRPHRAAILAIPIVLAAVGAFMFFGVYDVGADTPHCVSVRLDGCHFSKGECDGKPSEQMGRSRGFRSEIEIALA